MAQLGGWDTSAAWRSVGLQAYDGWPGPRRHVHGAARAHHAHHIHDNSDSHSHSRAKDAAITFVRLTDLVPGRDQVAVARFDTDAELVADLGGDRATVERAIQRLETRLDLGLKEALAELQSTCRIEGNAPVVVLLTDGMHMGAPGAELAAARAVRDAGVRLYTIGLGSDADST